MGPIVNTKTSIFTFFINIFWSYILWSPVNRSGTGLTQADGVEMQKIYAHTYITMLVVSFHPTRIPEQGPDRRKLQ